MSLTALPAGTMKTHAHKLKAILEKRFGQRLKISDSYSILAELNGFKNWNTMSAVIQQALSEKLNGGDVDAVLGTIEDGNFKNFLTEESTVIWLIRELFNYPLAAKVNLELSKKVADGVKNGETYYYTEDYQEPIGAVWSYDPGEYPEEVIISPLR